MGMVRAKERTRRSWSPCSGEHRRDVLLDRLRQRGILAERRDGRFGDQPPMRQKGCPAGSR
jgi:hypothetical protein